MYGYPQQHTPMTYRGVHPPDPQYQYQPQPFLSVDASEYYANWDGHPVEQLEQVHRALRAQQKHSLIFLAGDSSLDNKHWLWQGTKSPHSIIHDTSHAFTNNACNGYETVLRPPIMLQDVCYYLNKESMLVSGSVACINTSVEATTLGQREHCGLTSQDIFIKDNITNNDYLVVSIGGNDIALSPSIFTVCNLACLLCCSTETCIKNTCWCGCGYTCIKCCTCCPACSCGCAYPCGFDHFIRLFKYRVKAYIERLLEDMTGVPRRVLVCMIYYPDEMKSSSWAEAALSLLGYNNNPNKLQLMIKKVFELATTEIEIEGVDVIGVPLFSVMDGKNTKDYECRVEPSQQGGKKMASLIMKYITMGGGR
eukprot:GHVR01136673.1.p1 GENE.GHVR01136673.1~~GHVR01136673.1.p1  ORF type:complete len:366 (+),score=75.28 GHVR01136673.1:28-1125(+)